MAWRGPHKHQFGNAQYTWNESGSQPAPADLPCAGLTAAKFWGGSGPALPPAAAAPRAAGFPPAALTLDAAGLSLGSDRRRLGNTPRFVPIELVRRACGAQDGWVVIQHLLLSPRRSQAVHGHQGVKQRNSACQRRQTYFRRSSFKCT